MMYTIHCILLDLGIGQYETTKEFYSEAETLEDVKQEFYNTFLTVSIITIEKMEA